MGWESNSGVVMEELGFAGSMIVSLEVPMRKDLMLGSRCGISLLRYKSNEHIPAPSSSKFRVPRPTCSEDASVA